MDTKESDKLIIANKELAFQNEEKGKRAAELAIANKELAFQNQEKEKRADELIIANTELAFQNKEKEKRATELTNANKKLKISEEELKAAHKQLLFHFENIPFGFIEWDMDGHIKSKSKRAEEIFGWTEKE